MEQPPKEATPWSAVAAEQPRAAPGVPVCGVMDSAIVTVSDFTRLWPASTIATSGWVENRLPATAPSGWVLKTRRAGSPTVTANAWLTTDRGVPPRVAVA